MAIKPVLMFGNNILRQESKTVDFKTENINKMIDDLRDTLRFLQKEKMIGRALAAPQIGVLKQVIYMETAAENIIMVNPRIVNKSEETFAVWDSCFSADVAFFGKTLRAREMTVEYVDENRQKTVRTFKEDLSELFQHEIDHLHGVLFIDHIIDHQIIMRSEWERLYQ